MIKLYMNGNILTNNKIDMKQTLEEAARQELISSYAIVHSGKFVYTTEAMLNMFKKGAEWQANQSPWHEVSEEPKKGEHICVQVGSGNLTSWYAPSNIRKAFEDYNVIRWAYVSDLIKPTPQSINS